jgi:hypothetical protein
MVPILVDTPLGQEASAGYQGRSAYRLEANTEQQCLVARRNAVVMFGG